MKLRMRGAALLAGAMMISLGAMAGTTDSVVVSTTTVKFNRAEASAPAGAIELYDSLNSAAARVCIDPDAMGRLQDESYVTCRDAALAKAVGDVGIEAVSAIYQSDRARFHKGIVTVGQG